MITLNEVRQSLTAAKPSTELDRLIRRELLRYITTQDIYAELISHWPEIEAWPDYTEEMGDLYGDAQSALLGMCHPNRRYHSIPKPDDVVAIEGIAETITRTLAPLPVEDQLQVLSRVSDGIRSQIKIPG